MAVYQRLHRGRNERLPHSLIQRWKRIKRTNEKLRKLLHGLETDMAYEFDRISDHRQSRTPASRQEIREEMPGVSENLGDLFFKSNISLPSRLAKEAVRKIEDGHHFLLNLISDSAIAFEEKHKNSTRKHDHFSHIFMTALSSIYMRIFGKKPTTYREGTWCLFLSKILTVLEGDETTPDAAYKRWLEMTKLSSAA